MIKAKRIILLFVSLFMIIILAACGVSTSNNDYNTPSTSGNDNSTPNTIDKTPSGDTGQSISEDKYYTITFKNDNGDILSSDSYKEGTMPSYNGTPTKENTAEYSYTFSGWNPSITTVTKDCEYVATYNATKNNYYTVTWKNLTGDIIEVDENVKEGTMPEFNSTISIPKKLSEFISLFKDQYNIEMNVVFKSWDKEISPVTKNITYTATYESLTVLWYLREKNIVLYYADMVDGVMPEYKGETPKLECDEKNYYYEFDKFEYIVDNEGGFFIYYYAPKFNRLECKNTITFDLNGGRSTTNDDLYIKVNDIKDIEVPTSVKKSSYVFKGYEYNGVKVYDEYGKKVSDFELKENMTFIAIYEKKITLTVNYTIYDPNTNKQLSSYTNLPSGLGDISKTSYYDWNTYVDLHAYPSEGYTFVGWYNNGQVLSNEKDYKYMMWDEDFTIEARFKYTLYDLNVWSNNSNLGQVIIKNGNSQTFYNSQTLSKYYTQYVTIVAYTKSNTRRFLGWYDENNKLVSTNAAYDLYMPNRNYRLEAKWDNFNITYDLDGGTNNENNPTYYNVDMENISLLEPTKEGYTFQGWEYNGNVINEINTANICHMSLKALWTYYTLTTNVNNEKAGTITTYENVMITKGKEITVIAETNPGYTFNGWYNGDNELTKELSYTFNMLAENLEYTAKWTANTNTPYKVEHYLQNIDDDNYPSTPYETDNLTGTTDTLTNGSMKTYEGFTSPSITQVNINGDGSTVIKLNYTRNSYIVSLSINNEKAGSMTDVSGIYKYGKEITIKVEANPGYTFNGWYLNGSLYEEDESFNYTITSSDVSFEAIYIVNKYTITLDNQATGVTISGITSGNEYEYDSQIALTATNIPSGYTIGWTRSDDVVKSGDTYTFKVPACNITISTTITARPYTRKGNKIYFGTYPQTKVTATTDNGLLSITFDSSTWTSYRYYISSSQSDFMYYKDVDIDNNGTYDYRGVYFTQYRPLYPSVDSSTGYTYQDDNGYSTNTIYWFSYDPIEWDILTESSGKALIIANLILDSQDYYPNSSSSSFSYNGDTGYANNYELSAIRKFLNDNFYNTAFNEFQKALIKTTTVDNSAASTGRSSNSYACNNTNDKMFLLSYKDATTYYKNSTARQAKGSDYAKCQGLHVYSSDGNSYWRLRSPYYDFDYCAYRVDSEGSIYYDFVSDTDHGVRPACWINL